MSRNSQNLPKGIDINRLPTLPHVLVDILRECHGGKLSFQELATIVSRDAAISTRAVNLANSSFFNRGMQITSLERALLLLGTDTIKTIVITASIQQFFSGFHADSSAYLGEFWRKSLSCALLAKSVAILTSYPNPDEAYLCGLLHNIGELVLATNFTKRFFSIEDHQPSPTHRLIREREEFELDHAELGAVLSEDWGLSDYAVDAIRYHHAPVEAVMAAHHLVKIVHLGSELSEAGILESEDAFASADKLFELNPSLVQEIIRKIDGEVEEIATSMGIKVGQISKQQFDAGQVSLAREIRNTSLSQSSSRMLQSSSTHADLVRSVVSTFSLLFDIHDIALFWYEEVDNQLVQAIPENQDVAPLSFKVEKQRSIIADAALRKTIQTSSSQDNGSATLAVVDQQVKRSLNCSELLCSPLLHHDNLLGVLVLPLTQHADKKHQDFIEYLSAEIASKKHSLNAAQISTMATPGLEALIHRVQEVAHEASNPLNIISNYLSALSVKLREQPDVQEELVILREEMDRASQILLRLRDIEQAEGEGDSDSDINHEITSLIKLYKNSLFLSKKIHCETLLDKGLERNSLSRNALRQILTNLIKNAVEALPEGGRIFVSSSKHVNVNGRNFTEIKVQDNGPGIPDEILKDLFSPVTSTKGSGHSGLGLSITKNLVREYQGTISCKSSSKGTSFQVLLPSA